MLVDSDTGTHIAQFMSETTGEVEFVKTVNRSTDNDVNLIIHALKQISDKGIELSNQALKPALGHQVWLSGYVISDNKLSKMSEVYPSEVVHKDGEEKWVREPYIKKDGGINKLLIEHKRISSANRAIMIRSVCICIPIMIFCSISTTCVESTFYSFDLQRKFPKM